MVNPHVQAPNVKKSASNFIPIGLALFIKGFPSISPDGKATEMIVESLNIHGEGSLKTSPAIVKLPARRSL
jgi:hypothetical protein